jgi:hypothetical protein
MRAATKTMMTTLPTKTATMTMTTKKTNMTTNDSVDDDDGCGSQNSEGEDKIYDGTCWATCRGVSTVVSLVTTVWTLKLPMVG